MSLLYFVILAVVAGQAVVLACTDYYASNSLQYLYSHGSYDGSSHYSSNTYECFRIYADPNTYGSDARIVLTKVNFLLEGNCCSCTFDYVNIYDGDAFATSNALTGRLCGDGSDMTLVQSTGSYIYIYLTSDGSVENIGFMMSYVISTSIIAPTSVPRTYQSGCSTLGAVSSTQTLNSHSSYGFVSYSNGLDVCWIICDLTWTDVVEIKFNNFDLESSGSCAYDTLAVYDTSTYAGQNMGVHCGRSNPEDTYSYDHCLTLRFETDGSATYEGFQIEYRTVTEEYANSQRNRIRLSGGAIAGIVIGVIVLLGIIAVVVIVIIIMKSGSKGKVNSTRTTTTSRPSNITTISQSQGTRVHPTVRVSLQPRMRPTPMTVGYRPPMQPMPLTPMPVAQQYPAPPPNAYQAPPPSDPYSANIQPSNYPSVYPPPPPAASTYDPAYPPPPAMYPPPDSAPPPSMPPPSYSSVT